MRTILIFFSIQLLAHFHNPISLSVLPSPSSLPIYGLFSSPIYSLCLFSSRQMRTKMSRS